MKSTLMLLTSLALCSGLLCLPYPLPVLAGEEASLQPFIEREGRTITRLVAISGDGSTIVGYDLSPVDSSSAAFRWRNGLLTELSLQDGASNPMVKDVSRTGSVAVGWFTLNGRTQAFRWTLLSGATTLGDFPGNMLATAVSADGSTIAAQDSAGVYRWRKSDGFVDLGTLPEYPYLSVSGISADGSVIVGTGFNEVGPPVAFRWTAETGMITLGDLTGSQASRSDLASSADGATIVGQHRSPSGLEAFRWTGTEGMVGLGDLPPGDIDSRAYAVSADGGIVVGTSRSMLPTIPYAELEYAYKAFIWDQAHGMRSLKDVLAGDYGLDLTGWTLTIAKDISDDGRTIIGEGINPEGYSQAWIARLPAPTP